MLTQIHITAYHRYMSLSHRQLIQHSKYCDVQISLTISLFIRSPIISKLFPISSLSKLSDYGGYDNAFPWNDIDMKKVDWEIPSAMQRINHLPETKQKKNNLLHTVLFLYLQLNNEFTHDIKNPFNYIYEVQLIHDFPDSKVHVANMGPTWVMSAPDGPHVGPMNLAIRIMFSLLNRWCLNTGRSVSKYRHGVVCPSWIPDWPYSVWMFYIF